MKGILKLQAAIARCNEIIDTMTALDAKAELEAKLKKMSKADLITHILSTTKVGKGVTVQDICFTILEDEECQLLSYKDITDTLNAKIEGNKTSPGSMGWYKSHAEKYSREPLDRIPESRRLKIIAEM